MDVNPLELWHERAEAGFLPYGEVARIVADYGEVEAEYAALRKGAALMDAPHRGVVILTGKDRQAFLHNKVTNDVNRLRAGQGCYAYFLNLKGRIVLDMNILQAEEATLVEMDRRLVGLFMETMEKYLFNEEVRLLDGTGQLGRLTLIGPKAGALLAKVLNEEVEGLKEPLSHGQRMMGEAVVRVFRNDLAGEEQFELIVPRDQMERLWERMYEAGGGHRGGEAVAEEREGEMNLRAIGWSAFNTARIEAGTPLYGIDITEHYLPMETGPWYGRAVSVTKGCYLGQEIVARMHAHQTVSRLLVGLKMEGERLPMAGTEIFEGAAGGGQVVGMVTSSCHSPMLGHVPVGLGYVKKALAGVGSEVQVLAEGGRSKAVVSGLPLWRKTT